MTQAGAPGRAGSGGPADGDRSASQGVSRGQARHHHDPPRDRRGSTRRAADLIKRNWAAPTQPDQWWVADFSYVWTLVGFCYVSFVVDVFPGAFWGGGCRCPRRPRWSCRRSSRPCSPAAALTPVSLQPVWFITRTPGCQYTSISVHHRVDRRRHRAVHRHRRRRPGQRPDGVDHRAVQDRAHRPRTHRGPGPARPRSERETADWVHWFNQSRIHLSIGRMSPVRYEALWAATEPARTA